MGSPGYSKALGRKGQQEVRDILLKWATELGDRDITSRPMGSPGEDLILSEAAYKLLPYNIEVKHGKQVNMIRACQQAAAEARTGGGIPLAVGCYRLEKPKKWYACVELEHLLDLIKRVNT